MLDNEKNVIGIIDPRTLLINSGVLEKKIFKMTIPSI